MNWDYVISQWHYWTTYYGYFVAQWWFNFKVNLINNPGFVFLLWQNLMLTVCAICLWRRKF